jgi:hypothetical protein
MNRSLANKTRAVSKAARVVSKAAADNRSRASSQANSQGKAVSRVDNRSPGKAASKVSAKISPNKKTDFPRPWPGIFLAEAIVFVIVLDEA